MTTQFADTSTSAPSSGGAGGAPPVRVLIVDDEINLRITLGTFLSSVGCEVMTACEGGEGLQLLFNHHFDVVVSDLAMAPMDGITFLDEVRKIWPWMGVVIMSGYLDKNRFSRARELGVKSILAKPFSVADLQSAVFAEADRMRELVGSGDDVSITQLRYQLSLLGESTRSAIEAISLEQALEQLSLKLAKALPSVATAIMCLPVADGQPILAVSVQERIAPAYLARLEDLIRERYRKLSGTDMPPELELRVSEEQISPDGIPAFDNAVTFPLIDGGIVIGILAVVPPVGYVCSESDTLFLYNAANHVATVLMAFFRIRNVAAHDQLTGLYNRHHLKDAIKSIWGMARRHGYYVGVMMIDVDDFKSINDTYGHKIGDEVLREVSGLARNAFRSSDLLVRYGGDELVVILPDATSEGLESSSQRLLDLVREHEFSKDSLPLHCTISIGAAGINLGDEVDVDGETLLARADEAMYAAKLIGRDRYEIWANRDPRQAPDDKKSPADMPPSSSNPCVVLVDDDTLIVQVMERMLEANGFAVKTFTNGTDALAAVAAAPDAFQVALVDLHLGGTSGLELINNFHQAAPLLVNIVMTGDATLDTAVESLRHGAYDFLQKPVSAPMLRLVLNRALENHRLRADNRQYQQNLEARVQLKSRELTRALTRIRKAFDFTLHALTSMLESRERKTAAHAHRVQEITCLLARDFGMDESQLADMRQGALLHDIGKIGTPDAILLKQGPLTDEERAVMRGHVKTGYDLISSPDLKEAAELMLCHHEAYDGSGYPRGLRGEQIPLGARIFAVVDAYDAMRSDRPYRKGMRRSDALAELKHNSGSQFDPVVVETFLKRIDAIEKTCSWDMDESAGHPSD